MPPSIILMRLNSKLKSGQKPFIRCINCKLITQIYESNHCFQCQPIKKQSDLDSGTDVHNQNLPNTEPEWSECYRYTCDDCGRIVGHKEFDNDRCLLIPFTSIWQHSAIIHTEDDSICLDYCENCIHENLEHIYITITRNGITGPVPSHWSIHPSIDEYLQRSEQGQESESAFNMCTGIHIF
jgi:hypothetical protein